MKKRTHPERLKIDVDVQRLTAKTSQLNNSCNQVPTKQESHARGVAWEWYLFCFSHFIRQSHEWEPIRINI